MIIISVWGLIEHQPIHANLAHGDGELIKVDWLDDVAVHAQLIATLNIWFLARRSQDHCGNVPRAIVAFKASQHLNSVDQRQFQVQQDHFWRIDTTGISTGPKQKFQRLLPISHDVDVIDEVVRLECVHGKFNVERIILDQQDFNAEVGARTAAWSACRAATRR